VVSPRITRELLNQYAALPAVSPDGGPVTTAEHRLALSRLTEREHDVLLQLAGGLSNLEISQALVVTEATVKSHVTRILSKLGLRDRVQAVVFAYEADLVPRGRDT
jgi:DNA-binding NarL/FixJ family response regulator